MLSNRSWQAILLVSILFLTMACAVIPIPTISVSFEATETMTTEAPTVTAIPSPTTASTKKTPTETPRTPTATEVASISKGVSSCITDHLDDKYWSDKDRDERIALLEELQVEWVRMDIYQVVAEVEKSYDYYVEIVEKLNKKGIGVVLIVNHEGARDQPYEEQFDNAKKYWEFALEVAKHFRGMKVIYQLGNEPDYEGLPLLDYVEFVPKAYDNIKSVDPDSIVITAGVGASHAIEWLEGLYAGGAKGKFDGFAIHRYVYPNKPEKGHLDILRQLRSIAEENNDNIQVFMTETGWMTEGEEPVSEDEQAEYIADFYGMVIDGYSEITSMICLYRFADKKYEEGGYFGLMMEDSNEPDGYRKKPSYCFYQKKISDPTLTLEEIIEICKN